MFYVTQEHCPTWAVKRSQTSPYASGDALETRNWLMGMQLA